MPAHTAATTLPTWQGVALIVTGVVLAMLTPVLIRLNMQISKALFRWQMKVFGLEQTASAVPLHAKLERWRYASNLFISWLLSALLIVLGIAALLKQPFGTT